MSTNDVQLVSTELLPSELCIHVGSNYVDLGVDTAIEISGHKREYAIVGDAFFPTTTAVETPAWMVDLINDTIDNSLSAALGDIDSLKNAVLESLRELEVAKNQYEELINIEATIDSIISSRLATLNASLNNANAQIIELWIAKVTAEQAAVIAVDQISSELNSPTGVLYGAITNIRTTITNLNGELDAKYTDLYELNENTAYALSVEINRVEASIEDVAEAVVESMDLALATDVLAVAERTERLSASLSNGPMKWVGKFNPTIPASGSTTTVTAQVPAGSYKDRAGNTGSFKTASGSYTTPTPAPAKVTVVVNASSGAITLNFSVAVVLSDLDALKRANPGITNVVQTFNPAVWTATVPALPAPTSGTKHLEVVIPTGAFKTTTGSLVLGTSGFGSITIPVAAPSVVVEVDGQTGSVTARFSEAPCDAFGTLLTDSQVASIVTVSGATKGLLGKQGNTYKWLVSGSPTFITAAVAAGTYYGKTGVSGSGDTYTTSTVQPLIPDVLITLSASGQGVLRFSAAPTINNSLITVLGGNATNFVTSGSTVTFNVVPQKTTGSGITVNVPTGCYSVGGVTGKAGQLYAFVDPLVPEVFITVNIPAGEVVFSFNKPIQSFDIAAVLSANPFLTAIIPTQQITPTGPYATAERQVKVYADELEATSDSVQTVAATLNGKVASVEVSMGAFVTSLGTIGSRYGVKLTAGGIGPGGGSTFLVGGFELLNDGTAVTAGFDVDQFWVGRVGVNGKRPFSIIGGLVYIDSTVIQDASITNAKIGNEIQSTVFNSSVGWNINKNGNATFRNLYARGDIQASSLTANLVVTNAIRSSNFNVSSPASSPGWGIFEDGRAYFSAPVISRPNIITSGEIVRAGVGSWTGADFNTSTGNWCTLPDKGPIVMRYSDGNYLRHMELTVDLSPSDYPNADVWTTNGPLLGVSCVVTSADFFYSGGDPGNPYGRIGCSGTVERVGDLTSTSFIRIRFSIPLPDNLKPTIRGIHIRNLSWALLAIT